MDSSSFTRLVSNMMARYGGPAQAMVVGDGVYNALTSENVLPDPTQYDVSAMVFDFTLKRDGTTTEKDSLIQAGDKHVFMQPAIGMPALRPNKDFVVLGGVQYRIVTYKELNPSLTSNLLIELFVRT